jgi:1-acyl-sn-glycerol-3-phosphate acyltransferase
MQSLRAAALGGYAYIAMCIGLGSLALICLLSLPFALVFLCLPAALRVPWSRWMISTSFAFYLWLLKRLCFVELDHLALQSLKGADPVIVAANHPSLLDAVILLSCLPNGVCVMKAQLQNNLLFGPFARLSGYINNTDPMKLIKQSCDELAGGAQLLIFPEGTRTLEFPVNSFGKTTAMIACRSGVPVQTVFIKFSSPYLGKKWPLLQKPRLPLSIHVSLGEKFSPTSNAVALTQQLEAYYRQHLHF